MPKCGKEVAMEKMSMKYWIPLIALLLISAGFSVTAEGQQVLHGSVPPDIAKFGLMPISRLDSTKQLHFDITLPLRDQAGLTSLLQQIYDPTNPNYRHYLTVEQFTAEFAPTDQDYQSAIDFAKANGLTVESTSPNNMVLGLSGAVANIEKAFHVRMQVYNHLTEARTFYAPSEEPSLRLTTPILSVGRMSNYYLTQPRVSKTHHVSGQNSGNGSGPGNSYAGYDFRGVYAPGVSLMGSGQVVGIVAFDGFAQDDISSYEDNISVPSIQPHVLVTPVTLGGFNGLPQGLDKGDDEVCLDIESAISMAPRLSQVLVYEMSPDSATSPCAWHTLLSKMATDNIAKQLSCSWYIPSGLADPAADQIFQEMAAQGQSFFNASGDKDAFIGLIDFPGDSPYITQVGGTTLSTTRPPCSYISETVWNSTQVDGQGSGGGISTQYSMPSWQQGVSGCLGTMRNIPDVALIADNLAYFVDGYPYGDGWGTSYAAPLWAGFCALVNQQLSANGGEYVGFINPSIYQIGKSSQYANCFHDIQTGNNEWSKSLTKFSAALAPGYDLCTGWGTPNGQNLINALTATVWSGSVTLNSNLTIPSGGNVSVLPGTTVHLGNGVSIIVNGNLQANSATFTSTGGTSPGAWGSIQFSGAGATGSTLSGCTIQYGTQMNCTQRR